MAGCSRQNFPMRYLGVPLFFGRVKRRYFEDLKNKLAKRIDGWKAKLLSFGGKINLLKLSSVVSQYFPLP